MFETVAQDAHKLNIVVILVDDMGWTDLSGIGNEMQSNVRNLSLKDLFHG